MRVDSREDNLCAFCKYWLGKKADVSLITGKGKMKLHKVCVRLLAVISKLKVTVYVIALIEILYTVNFTFLQIIGGYNNGKMD